MYGRGRRDRVLVFPEPEHDPAMSRKVGVALVVAHSIRGQFVDPPLPVLFRDRSVLWTAMPKAPVDVYDDLVRGQDDVGASSTPVDRDVDTEAETQAMQSRSEFDLWFRVSSFRVAHPITGGVARRGWCSAA